MDDDCYMQRHHDDDTEERSRRIAHPERRRPPTAGGTQGGQGEAGLEGLGAALKDDQQKGSEEGSEGDLDEDAFEEVCDDRSQTTLIQKACTSSFSARATSCSTSSAVVTPSASTARTATLTEGSSLGGCSRSPPGTLPRRCSETVSSKRAAVWARVSIFSCA